MKKIKYLVLLVPAIVLLSLAFCFKHNKENDNGLTSTIIEILENYHYEPQAVNNGFSKKLFNLYIKRLDNNKRFFLKSDIDSLKQWETELDDQAKIDDFTFFDKANEIHLKRVNGIETWYKEILNKPFDFKAKENFEFNEDSSQFLNTESELKEFWRKSIKQQVLERLYNKLEIQENATLKKDTIVKIKPYDTLEKIAREEVLKTHNDWFSRLKKFNKKDKKSLYINCITELFDPHTNYFPPKEKENFDIRMSGKLEGIGAQLQEKDGFLKVSSIVPGSASYQQGELKAGDIIIKVAQGAEEPVSVVNMDIDDAILLIRGKKGTEVRLTVKKPDETIKVIPIIRDVVVLEEGFAKSAIINVNNKKFGYIYLPTFYADMDDRKGRFCSVDVAKEVEKLKKDKVEGIILDLRNNGGGSLQDVVDMGGLFIDKGPITQVKARGANFEPLSDNDGKVMYDGPLTIMVNENSASASEILAAAMQDYKRAAIIGNTTFGKGTVQRFLDLDGMISGDKSESNGSLKITIQKFYRINGGTTQLVGVTPDILIPDRYKYIEFGEKDNENPLGVDYIDKADYSTNLDYSKCIKKAKENSQKRIEKSQIFQQIELLAQKIKKQSERSVFTLNLEEYRAEQKQLKEDNKLYEESIKKINAISVMNNSTDENELKNDALKLKIKNDWNKNFEKDIYIQEALEVLKDLKK